MAGMLQKRFEIPDKGRFEIVVYDLLYEPVDAIVNAANGRLAHGGGVAFAISRAAGKVLQQDGDRIIAEQGVIPTGGAVVTKAGKLPFKGIIHAVGPYMGEGNEEALIIEALGSAFQCAHDKGWRSVSFPAISSGIFSVPYDICSRAYYSAVKKFFLREESSSLTLIRLCLLQGPLLKKILEDAESWTFTAH